MTTSLGGKALVTALILGGLTVGVPVRGRASDFPGPYVYSGDGRIRFQSPRGGGLDVVYRREAHHDEAALRRINHLFGAPWDEPTERVQLRLIELLDHLQDHFGGAAIALRSGYRSPAENASLRTRGRLAAQSSMHLEGAAVDCHLQGVTSERVFDYVKSLGCCGVGYYHGREVHIDTGPARFWDETTSGAESREPQENAKITVTTDRDRYRSGEAATLAFLRITNYPIHVPAMLTMEWQPLADDPTDRWHRTEIIPTYRSPLHSCGGDRCPSECAVLRDRREARLVTVVASRPPRTDGPVRARLRVPFCHRFSARMPAEIISKTVEIW